MTLDEVAERVADDAASLLDEYKESVQAHADESPAALEDLPEGLITALTLIWNQAIDDLAISANELTNQETGEAEPSTVTEDELLTYKTVGVYYFLEAMRSSFHRLHSASIALQIADDDREQAVSDALAAGKDDLRRSSGIELSFAFGMFIMREQLSRGIDSYRWRTKGDSRVRPTHASNEGRVFSWGNPPATGHPGTAHNCRCSAIPNLLTGKHMKIKAVIPGLSIKAMAEDHIKIEISGIIGDEWDGFNTTDWMVKYWNGINDSTKVIDVDINSPGGDLSHGIAIYTFLKSHPAQVNTRISGEASSAASLIFAAGDNRYMPAGTFAGLHNPYAESCFCDIDYRDAESLADQLRPMAEAMNEIYASVMNIGSDEIRTMMDKRAVLTSAEAIRLGFATGTGPGTGVEMTPGETMAHVLSIKARMLRQSADFLTRALDGDETTGADSTQKKMGSVAAVAEIKAKHDVLAHQVNELKTENARMKAELKSVGDRETELRKSIRAQVLEEQAKLADIKARSASIGMEPEGDTAEAIMLFVIQQKGVKDASPFVVIESDGGDVAASKMAALKAVFDAVIAQYSNSQSDSVWEKGAGGVSDTVKKAGTWGSVNRGAK